MRFNLDKKSLALAGIILLSGSASFGLGRLSVLEQARADDEVQIIVPELKNLSVDESNFNFVASKSGTKYYPIDCKSANRIKPENRVYFMTEEEASNSKLERSSTCSF